MEIMMVRRGRDDRRGRKCNADNKMQIEPLADKLFRIDGNGSP